MFTKNTHVYLLFLITSTTTINGMQQPSNQTLREDKPLFVIPPDLFLGHYYRPASKKTRRAHKQATTIGQYPLFIEPNGKKPDPHILLMQTIYKNPQPSGC